MTVLIPAVGFCLAAICAYLLVTIHDLKRMHSLEMASAVTAHRLAMDAAAKRPVPTATAEEILHDLTRGPSLIRIERVAIEDVYLRRPQA